MATYSRAGMLDAPSGRPIMATLATSARQADGLALRMSGVQLDRFLSNPVLMVVHDHRSLPVGRVEDVTVGSDRLTGRLVFASDPEAQVLERRVREGVISAVSIGFDIDPNTLDEWGNVGRWTLTETSLVGVPMDAEALVFSRAAPRPAAVDAAAARAMLDEVFGPAVPAAPPRRVETLEQRILRLLPGALADVLRDR